MLEKCKNKSCRGVKSISDAEKFIEAGAERLGTSSICKILKMKIQQIIKVFNLWIGLQKLKFNYKYKEQQTEEFSLCFYLVLTENIFQDIISYIVN